MEGQTERERDCSGLRVPLENEHGACVYKYEEGREVSSYVERFSSRQLLRFSHLSLMSLLVSFLI